MPYVAQVAVGKQPCLNVYGNDYPTRDGTVGRGYSVLEVVHAFEQASGKPVPYRFVPRRPGDVAQPPLPPACSAGAPHTHTRQTCVRTHGAGKRVVPMIARSRELVDGFRK